MNFNKAREQHHNGTGQWLLASDVYSKWRTERSSFLWLNGIPGYGKMILSSSVVTDLAQSAAPSQNLLYFYFDSMTSEGNPVRKPSDRLFTSYIINKRVPRKEVDALYSFYENGGRQPDQKSLCTHFQNMIQHDNDFWVVLDALDECHARKEGSRYGLLPWFRNVRNSDKD